MARRAAPTRPVPVELAPVVLVRGSEGLLGDRIMDQLRARAFQADPATERTDIEAATYRAGQLDVITSPSLFGESRLVVVWDLESLNDALLDDLLAYLKRPAPDVWLLLRHNGGVRGKKLLDAIAKSGAPVHVVDPLKKDSEKLELLRSDARRAGRRIDQDAAQALVDALGSDLRSLAGALAQLIDDVEGPITAADVRRYHAGRMEVTGFEVADAAIAGRTAQALTLLRHAFATGVDPVPLVGALAMKVRSLAKVSVAGAGDNRRLGMSSWQVERARRELHGWDDSRMAAAVKAVALADEEVKGLSRDPQRAVEKAVITLCRLRAAR